MVSSFGKTSVVAWSRLAWEEVTNLERRAGVELRVCVCESKNYGQKLVLRGAHPKLSVGRTICAGITFGWIVLKLSGTGNSEPDLLKLTRGSFRRRVPFRSGTESTPYIVVISYNRQKVSFTSEEYAFSNDLFQDLAITLFVTESHRIHNVGNKPHENEAP